MSHAVTVVSILHVISERQNIIYQSTYKIYLLNREESSDWNKEEINSNWNFQGNRKSYDLIGCKIVCHTLSKCFKMTNNNSWLWPICLAFSHFKGHNPEMV